MTKADRFEKQGEIVPRSAIVQCPCTIVGCGAIGRQVARMLAAIGVPRLKLIDFDTVDESNVTTQGYSYHDVGEPKPDALRRYLLNHYSDVEVACIGDRFRRKYMGDAAVFCCVDKIAARETIWNGQPPDTLFWADGRMLGEVLRILAASRSTEGDWEYYPRTLFREAEAQVGRCTTHSTIFASEICAGFMVHQFTRYLRGIPVDRDVMIPLLAGEIEHIVEPEPEPDPAADIPF